MSRIDKLKELLETSSEDSFLQHALALEYVKEGRDKEARKLFEAILKREPTYTGSYYHLGKLLERLRENSLAITWYEKGMAECKLSNDRHAYNELQGALDDISE